MRRSTPFKAGRVADDECNGKEACIMKPNTTTTFAPGPTPNTVRAANGTVLTAPEGWVLLPPGDAALTRRVKAASSGGAGTITELRPGRKD